MFKFWHFHIFFFLICKYIKTGIYTQFLLGAICLSPNSVLHVLHLQWVLSKREKSKCILSYQHGEVDAFKINQFSHGNR